MFNSNWLENGNGNFVMLDGGSLLATVFKNSYGVWQIIVNSDEGGKLVGDENFESAEDATERADAILAGAPCGYARKNSVGRTDWAPQKAKANGKPTYGRKDGKSSVTVKCASSGKWFYMTYNGPSHSEPQGWYNTAEKAMQAYDGRNAFPPDVVDRLQRLFGG